MFKGTNLSIFLSNTSHCLLFGCKENLIVVLICIYLMANKNGWTFFPVFTSHFHTPPSRLLVRSLESTVYNGSQSMVSSLPWHTHTHSRTQTHTHTPSSITITRDLIRKSSSQALSQVTWIRNSKNRAQKSMLQQALQVTPNSLKYKHLSQNQWHRILFLTGCFHSILSSNIWSSNFLAIHIWETSGYTKKFFTQNFSDPLIYEHPKGIHSA